jgi:serine/threonine protein kinase
MSVSHGEDAGKAGQIPMEQINHQEQGRDEQHRTEYTEEDSDDTSSSGSEYDEDNLRDQLLASMQLSRFERTPNYYLPNDQFEGIFQIQSTMEGVRNLTLFEPMGVDAAAPTDDDLSLANHILENCRKLYLIAIFIELEPVPLRTIMAIFRQEGFADHHLPIDVWPMDKLKDDIRKHPFVCMEKQHLARKPRIWNFRRIERFQSDQWRFLAPTISTTKPIHDFGQLTIPFVEKHAIAGSGTYGIVYKYEIHHAHFEDPKFPRKTREVPLAPQNDGGSQTARRAHVFAVKEIRKEGSDVAEQWEAEVKVLTQMNKLNQKHIVRFITAFRCGKPDYLDHYVMFEWADGGNLSDLWEVCPNPVRTSARTKWAIRQLYGLAKALSKVHYLEHEGRYNGASYCHGDLKPANILWFQQGDSEFGTLKISDWGEAKEYYDGTPLRRHTSERFGTRRYEPPEVATVATGVKRSRLYDIWSIGCITLEFLIWLMYGLGELKKFNQKNVGDYGISDMFYEIAQDKPTKVHAVVEHWMEHMAKDPRCARNETALGDVLEIVRTGLLVVKLPPEGGAKRPQLQSSHFSETLNSEISEAQPAVGIGENTNISISITHELKDSTPSNPGEPTRYLATDLRDQLQKISANEDESYWYNRYTSRPAPVESRRSNLLSVKSGLIALTSAASGYNELEPSDETLFIDSSHERRVEPLSEESHAMTTDNLGSKGLLMQEKISALSKTGNDDAPSIPVAESPINDDYSTSLTLQGTNSVRISQSETLGGTDQTLIEAKDSFMNDDVLDTDSVSSHVTTPREKDGKAEIAHFLASNPELRPIFSGLLEKSGQTWFVKEGHRFLKSFYLELLTEVQSELQTQSTQLLKSRNGRVRISQDIVEIISAADVFDAEERRKNIEQSRLRKERLESWAGTYFPTPAAPSEDVLKAGQHESGQETHSQASDDSRTTPVDEGDEYVPNITQLKAFFRNSRSFQVLINDFKSELLPHSVRDILSATSVELSNTEDDSLINRLKACVEDYTMLEWNWWPLEPCMRPLKLNESRVIWRCVSEPSHDELQTANTGQACGTRLWEKVSVEESEIIRPMLPSLNRGPSEFPHCLTVPKEPSVMKQLAKSIAYTVSSMSGGQQATASSATDPISRATTTTTTVQGTRMGQSNNDRLSPPQQQGDPSASAGSGQPNHNPPSPSQQQQGPSAGSSLGQSNNKPLHPHLQQATWRWILFGVDAPHHSVNVEHIWIHDSVDDTDFFRSVREHYRKHRGIFNLLFSIRQLGYCDGVKVNEIL